MKKFFTIALTILAFTSAKAEQGNLGKPNGTSSDTVTGTSGLHTFTMAINNTSATPLSARKQLGVELVIKAVDSVKTAYAKLQCRLAGTTTWCDVGATATDTTAVTFTATTTGGTTKGYLLRAPSVLTPTLLYADWRLILYVTDAQKFTATGAWVAN